MHKVFFRALFICCLPVAGFCQQFKYTAPLNHIDTNGFYSITMTPQLSAVTNTDLSDIRIMIGNKNWVPHLVKQSSPTITKNTLNNFSILKNTIVDSGRNLVILENKNDSAINNIALFIKNSIVCRLASLSGSNNQQDWFIIDDHISIARTTDLASDEFVQPINFPVVKYRFFKLVIDNKKNDPLLISNAGYYSQSIVVNHVTHLDNPAAKFSQKDSGAYSYIKVEQSDNYHFDQLKINTSGPKFYDRDIELYLPSFDKNNNAQPGLSIGHFKLQSGLPAIFQLKRVKTKLFFIVIHNADNPPLQIDKVSTQQQQTSLIAYLEKGKNYHLLMGDSLAKMPDYDLHLFKDSIHNLRSVNFGTIEAVKAIADDTIADKSNKWIWPLLIIAALVLSFLTYRLTRDFNTSKN